MSLSEPNVVPKTTFANKTKILSINRNDFMTNKKMTNWDKDEDDDDADNMNADDGSDSDD